MKRVLLGMSGGVDSSVAAALLQKQGLDVIGITMQLVPKEKERDSACCNLNAINDAKRVAHQLGIPHYTINIRDDFKRHVIDYFVNEYLIGNTPNPCVECNRYIKFSALEDKAKELGADYVATGHYCDINDNNGMPLLKKAADLSKDQSYFLYMLSKEQLNRCLFPLGPYKKSEVRAFAEEFGLLTAKKSESQDICFVTKGSYREFIEAQIEKKGYPPGPIVDTDGNERGTHTGIYHYTIGQRRGLNISNETPLYVVKIDAPNNTIIVGPKDALEANTITIKDPHVTHPDALDMNKSYSIKIRFQMTAFEATITSYTKEKMTLEASSPLNCISPGQSCVIYDGDSVIGGGIIL